MEIIDIKAGALETNCYIVAQGQDAVVIDPGADAEKIIAGISARDLTIHYILLTHGHWDHKGALNEMIDTYQRPVLLHSREAAFIKLPPPDCSPLTGTGKYRLLDGGETITAGALTFRVLPTPGHTPGGVCFLFDSHCITGDTLFNDGIGRSDFEGGDYDTLIQSIKTHLLTLPDSTSIHPGHGPSSTIGRERRYFSDNK